MTTEIVILNKSAVALAADSAVTLSNGKVYNSANKLFMLCPGHKVGVLLYNQDSILGLPWEILITDYGKKLSDLPPETHLETYIEKFISWINVNLINYLDSDHHLKYIDFLIHETLAEVVKDIWNKIWDNYYKTGRRISESLVIKYSKESITKQINRLRNRKRYFSKNQLVEIHDQLFEGRFKQLVDSNIDDLFVKIPTDESDLNGLKEIIFLAFTRDSSSFTGIVFAGYGEKDFFPTTISYRFENPICEYLKYRKVEEDSVSISLKGVHSAIVPLAQKDVISSFVTGVHPEYLQTMTRSLSQILPPNELATILSDVEDQFIKPHTESILNAVYSLSKEDLAMMAETFVDLTSFMRKVSMDPNTVGGPVDVAIVSRSDGFVWIKKKMYFTNDKNLHIRYNK